MMIRVSMQHHTRYTFDRQVKLSPHILRLRPAPHTRTPVHGYRLHVEPSSHFLHWQQDAFGNHLARLVFQERTSELDIKVDLVADLPVINPFDFFLDETATEYPFAYTSDDEKALAQYRVQPALTPLLEKFYASLKKDKQPTNAFLVSVNQRLADTIQYQVRPEAGIQTPEETLAAKSGSCRDSAWLLIAILRLAGFAARFASGYLIQLATEATTDSKEIKEDFSDLHAWCEIFLPGAGWVGLDPTSGLFAGEGHIPLACTPEPHLAAPVTGTTSPAEVDLGFSSRITRLQASFTENKPADNPEHEAILKLGDTIDSLLEKENMCLSQGAEPTFVSVHDRESAAWHTEALSEDKLALANQLFDNLKQQFAPDALVHKGLGKWYPGESAPRWALGLIWRKDGLSIPHSTLFSGKLTTVGKNTANPEMLIHKIADCLGLPADCCKQVFEDAAWFEQQYRQMPREADNSTLTNGQYKQWQFLTKKKSCDLSQPVGVILPLRFDPEQQQWQSCIWKMDRIVLIPGESQAGLRLPLHLMGETDPPCEQDPFEESTPLQDDPSVSFPMQGKLTNDTFVETLCIERYEHHTEIFIPKVFSVNAYLILVAAIASALNETDSLAVLTGYLPPNDPRMNRLLITPDPGVIEVNLHPATHWRELVHFQETLYREAAKTGLTAIKFQMDGRQTGTGGGQHITLGSLHPKDSPWLRKPDLLQSFITFWQHHPALSYFFSGLFIGPTSQAPRIDEARLELLDEMELAFAQITHGENLKPWLIDRLFRNLLVDVTGNTHRSEFCIDKLYSPDSPTGRWGVLELRAFEMPQDVTQSLTKHLLVRALFLLFCRKPYQHPLTRFGTLLHDKYLLPYYLFEDMEDIVEYLNSAGIAFKSNWLRPFEETRFPVFGETRVGDITIELRAALEPWLILGEEIGKSGTSRYVDSSVERLQVKVTGLAPNHFALYCNDREVPLQETRIANVRVAGVKFKAWRPASGLHPLLAVNSPLSFSVFDRRNQCYLGGCTYHVTHPGGRQFDSFPLNKREADARMLSRFDTTTRAGKESVPPPGTHSSYQAFPFTLDLRQRIKPRGNE